MRRYGWTAVMLAGLLSAAGLAPADGTPDGAQDGATGQVVIVQAYPEAFLDVRVDGEVVARDAAVRTVLDPLELVAGEHEVTFSDRTGGAPLATTISVGAGSSSDVVLHRPASTRGGPVVSVYRTPRRPIGPGKARVLLAHTATVAPADVEVDGTVVFTDIANGEFAQADLPAGTHRVSLLPTGATTNPLLGPLELSLAPATATMVYAVGTPSDGSMDVIVHTVRLATDGSVAPTRIDTGSGGRAAHLRVHPFG